MRFDPGDEDQAVATVLWALERGINYFDTALDTATIDRRVLSGRRWRSSRRKCGRESKCPPNLTTGPIPRRMP